jgi:hypothetical protein
MRRVVAADCGVSEVGDGYVIELDPETTISEVNV